MLKGIPEQRRASAIEKWDNAARLLGARFETFFSHVFAVYGRGDTKIIAGVRRTISEAGGPEAFLNKHRRATVSSLRHGAACRGRQSQYRS